MTDKSAVVYEDPKKCLDAVDRVPASWVAFAVSAGVDSKTYYTWARNDAQAVRAVFKHLGGAVRNITTMLRNKPKGKIRGLSMDRKIDMYRGFKKDLIVVS